MRHYQSLLQGKGGCSLITVSGKLLAPSRRGRRRSGLRGLRCGTATGGRNRRGGRIAVIGVARVDLELPKLAQQHIIRRLVLRVLLEDRPFKILHGIRLTVQLVDLLELLRQRVALLSEATMLGPVLE